MVIHSDTARRVSGGRHGAVWAPPRRRENKRGISKAIPKVALDIVTVSGVIFAVGFIGAVENGGTGLMAGAVRALVSLSVSGIASFIESLI